MLETRDLCKTYKPKKGVPVQAVDHVSLRFPERGMVFLLGKSGSGKSTMLNLLGGLDQYDGGEIIIKGISSKDFNQQRFDSYRNTYVGFIFQEYNILEEFTVGANIALALELQGRTATDEEINTILKEVDLEGFGSRKPNELSGGQKQRVAIARALVKNPEIIMADEPTGALDSNTGRQVLDTLKKLSAEKLVILVSHDREYAEAYADRIIELADGKVIRDVEAVHKDDGEAEKTLVFRSTSIEIPPEYHLTEEDRIQINEYLDKLRSGASLMLPSNSQRFTETDESQIPQQDGSKFSLIKSKLPMKSAFKIGCSSLKHKRFRLVMTILLSVVAFTLFALVDTFSSYDHIRACTDSLIDSDVNYVSVNRQIKCGEGLEEYWSSSNLRFSDEQMKALTEKTGVPVTGIFIPRNANLSFVGMYEGKKMQDKDGRKNVNFINHFCGFAEITTESLKAAGIDLIAGALPDGAKNEIAVSLAVCETFIKGGYNEVREADNEVVYDAEDMTAVSGTSESEDAPQKKYDEIRTAADLIGRTFTLCGTKYTVSGVVDTHFDFSRFDRILKKDEQQDNSDRLINYLLRSEMVISTNYSLTGCAMVGKGKVGQLIEEEPKVRRYLDYADLYINIELPAESNGRSSWTGCYGDNGTTLDQIPDEEILWLDGKKEKLGDKEFIISLAGLSSDNTDLTALMNPGSEKYTDDEIRELVKKMLGSASVSADVNYPRADSDGDSRWENLQDCTIVGVIKAKSKYNYTTVMPDEMAEKLLCEPNGVYDTAVGGMPESRDEIERFVAECYPTDKNATERYALNHPVTFELDTFSAAVKVLAKVFLYIGIGFAVFAALLMANFITTSIHYKRQEIGILRAIGSRSMDVFRIFFSESFVIAMINFVLSSALCYTAVSVINYFLRTKAGILVTLLHFGIRQIVLLFFISVAIAAVASFLPVRKIAAKKPIDAIRGH